MAPMTPGTWLTSARLGLYFCWGPHALYERGAQVLSVERLDQATYRERALEFSPYRFDPGAWAELAREAGARWALLSARGSDGYCLFPSSQSTFCSPRNLVTEFLAAFRRSGLFVGVGCSLGELDCAASESDASQGPERHAQAVARAHAQIQELLSTCGLLDMVRIEIPPQHAAQHWDHETLISMVQRLQPTAVVTLARQRLGGPSFGRTCAREGDAAHSKRELGMPLVQRHWGYHAGDQVHRSTREIVSLLAGCAARGERLLLGVGPRADGSLPHGSSELLRDVGQWLSVNGAAIHHAGPSSGAGANLGHMTASQGVLYLTVLYWPGSSLHLAGVSARVLGVRFLADGWAIDWRQEGGHLWLRNLPTLPPDPRGTVIVIAIDQQIA